MNFTDVLLVWNTGRTARNTRQIAEMATWTEEMKAAYWVEQARQAKLRAEQSEAKSIERGCFAIFLGVIFVIMALMSFGNLALNALLGR
jgi:hypothetical protein